MNTVLTEPKKIVGLFVRTNNLKERSKDDGQIGPLVHSYFSKNVASTIQHAVFSTVTYLIYTDYETDETGDYTCFIGTQVDSFNDQPVGLSSMEIPGQMYEKITTQTGSLPGIVIEAWKEIWADISLKKRRTFGADFEVYDARAADPNAACVDIFIGVD